MANKGKIAIGLFALMITIFGIMGIANSFSTLKTDIKEIENKIEVCSNWKADLDAQKAQMSELEFSEESIKIAQEYSADLADYNIGCGSS